MALAALALSSCDDFLDRRPMDFGDEDSYYKTAEDLRIAANAFYENLPKNKELFGGLYSEDNVSDNQASNGAQNLFYPGEKLTVEINSSDWNFRKLRGINFFINKTEANIQNGILSTSVNGVNHYLGEGYFFRAYDYFRLLRNFGDVPILTEMQKDNPSELAVNSKRAPRNEVARFILSDLDRAAELMDDTHSEAGRVTRQVALALKARVALYEATWEKYHAGTCFVPGNAKWVGKDYWPEFAFKAGSAEAEVNFFLDQAIAASQEVADARALNTDYLAMFNNWETNFGATDEVLLARYYASGILTHSGSAFAIGACGATRAAVNTYLMASGLPIYADANYQGDKTGYEEMQGRDERLTGSIRFPGRVINTGRDENGKVVNDTVYFFKPNITGSGNEKATTGYVLNKWVSADKTQATQYLCTTAVPLFRSAEARLIYMEAYYERHHSLDAKATQYWQELRKRAGVDEDFSKTIAATDLNKENDLGVYSHGNLVDATLYNIRRERRCELFAEGLRLDDLKRWRSLDNMIDYQVEGINLWGGSVWEMYGNAIKSSNAVSISSLSDYLRPLQLNASSKAYNGYNFPKPHYLEPIPLSEFLLVNDQDGSGIKGQNLYQNPGWPSHTDGTADYSYDCD